MTDDEAVAIAMALALRPSALSLSKGQDDSGLSDEPMSRWRVADRKPDLEIEELRAIH